ncbi:MAG: hypothetical protein WD052_03860 [Bacteroidales bacterium]
MDIYSRLPEEGELRRQAEDEKINIQKVNGHFHTPYSYSAFSSIEQACEMAEKENVQVLGINDFYTMTGYDEFADLCIKYRKFPLFNIEFMGLLKNEQSEGLRVNDPGNPGRTYFSGKGLDYPISLKGPWLEKLEAVRQESDNQMIEMVQKASDHLEVIDPALKLNYDDILKNFTRGMVRERHIAMVIRRKISENYVDDASARELYNKIYNGSGVMADLSDTVAVEEELRAKLLKVGGVAYVMEDLKAYLEIPDVSRIILDAGGIPCYPVLLDDKHGNYTEFEEDKVRLFEKLSALNIYSVELIPGRNKIKAIRSFVEFFDRKGFVITFGTEHNTLVLDPLTVRASDSDLDDYLNEVNFKGAAVIAAHQYLRSQNQSGFVDEHGLVVGDRAEFVKLGNFIINNFINQ